MTTDPVVVPDADPTIDTSITFNDFLKVDMRYGFVTDADRVPKSNKLIRMNVDFGPLGCRQILAGVGLTFQPADLQGKTYLFVVNLAPRMMMGLESHGMMLASGEPTDLSLLTATGKVPTGERVG